MNSAPVIALALVCAVCAAAEPGSPAVPAADELSFRNGDLLRGELVAVSPPATVRWRHPDAAQPIDFSLDSVARIDLAARPQPPTGSNTCRFLFANGDLLAGRLVSCDAVNVVVDTWPAGRLTLPRASLQSLVLVSEAPALFDGITGLDGWTQASASGPLGADSGHWVFRHGAFYAGKPASIARDFKLPAQSRIEFDLAWKGNPNLAIALYTDSLQPIMLSNKEAGPDFGGFYSFRFNGVVVELWPIKKHGPTTSLGSVVLPALARKDHARFDLRASRPQGRVILLIDKTPVMLWTDPNGFAGEGGGIRFVQNLGGAIKLSNLRVTEWDGLVEDKPAPTSAATNDWVWLQSGRSIPGIVNSVQNDTVALNTGGRLQEIPFSTVREIDFAAPAEGRPAEKSGGVRAIFAQGGSVGGELEGWSPEGVVLRSPDFGRATFNPAAFVGLEFLPANGVQ